MIYDPLCIMYRTITNIPRYLEIPIVIGIYGLLHNHHNLLLKKKKSTTEHCSNRNVQAYNFI